MLTCCLAHQEHAYLVGNVAQTLGQTVALLFVRTARGGKQNESRLVFAQAELERFLERRREREVIRLRFRAPSQRHEHLEQLLVERAKFGVHFVQWQLIPVLHYAEVDVTCHSKGVTLQRHWIAGRIVQVRPQPGGHSQTSQTFV